MATLNVAISTTGEAFVARDIDFTEVTPKDILANSEDFNLPPPPQGEEWRLLRGSTVVDENTTLDKLGFKDGDTAQLMTKVKGAKVNHL